MIFSTRSCFIIGFIFLVSCKPMPQTAVVEYKDYQITKEAPVDSSFIRFLAPYGSVLKSSMGKVIGFSTEGLSLKQPESTIGNFMADAMKQQAEKHFNQKVDAAFVNYGGVRSNISKGKLTVGMIFELMPFDNLIVLQKLSGKVLMQLLDKIAVDVNGGWPMAGITMEIKDKKATHVLVNGQALNTTNIYIVANSDYVANGGNDCAMLKGIAQMNKGILLRDALIEYVSWLTANGKSIDAKIENRTTNVN
ncbi:MAG: 5'-nucleotidase C-terminal domain-containing protein [Bacteroidetes bacterium]|nr:5'-nucleotidase C-terminal domain-containing protein [Bacteroidota bacterium]